MASELELFDAECCEMSIDELKKEYDHYTREIDSASTSTAISSLLVIPTTLGISLAGVGLSATIIHKARHKREIVEEHLKIRQSVRYVKTSTSAVVAPMIATTAVGVCTLGLAPQIADIAIANGADELPGKVAKEAKFRLTQLGLGLQQLWMQ